MPQFIRTNSRNLLRDLDAKTSKVEQSSTRALNRAGTQMRTAARRLVQADLNIKARDINAALSLRRAHRATLAVTLTVAGRPIPLVLYGARARAKGVSVKVKRRGSRKLVRSAFIASRRGGGQAVFQRAEVGGRRAGRLPIEELLSTSVRQFLDTREHVDRVHDVGEKGYRKEFARLMDL